MSCTESSTEVAERYLRGALDEASASTFEDHYFECERCFATLQDLRALREELSTGRATLGTAGRASWASPWLPLAALVVLGSAGAFWYSRARPVEAPAPTAATTTASILAELARVDAPAWTPVQLRGAESEASVRFGEAMVPYAKRDWPAALPLLREAARLDPGAPEVSFYRGASALLAGETPEAIESLRRVVSLGETPFLDEAHFLLAKAQLRSGNLPAAQAELRKVVELGGERRATARQLVERLALVTPTPP